MSKTLMRGLALLETIDLHGPIAIMELVRHTGIDKSIVSRTIAALEREGWVVRHEAKVELGPRAALLGHSSLAAQAVRQAEPLVHAIAGVTGLLTQAYGLVGSRALVLAAAGGRGPSTSVGLGSEVPLFATAAGKTVAAQLDADDLARRLPSEPFPDPAAELAKLAGYGPFAGAVMGTDEPLLPSDTIATSRDQLDRQLADVRRSGFAMDNGELHPRMGCLAVPWPLPGLPSALACMGSPADVTLNETVVKAALRTAASMGSRPEDVVASAAGMFSSTSG
jgi:IclR family transcriptional regulator, pca regulon regulatory protein